MRKKILIVGLARNLESHLTKSLGILLRSFEKDYDVTFYVVESDSTDRTTEILRETKNRLPIFQFVSLGNLRIEIPDRVERIRHCRNVYVQYIRANHSKLLWDFIAVADLDGINNGITARRIRAIRKFGLDWDVLACNQLAPYYDIYALRSKGWVEYDCLRAVWSAQGEITKRFLSVKKRNYLKRWQAGWQGNQLRRKYIYSKMRFIPFWGQPFEVESAFGGIAIYKTSTFLSHDYSLIEGDSSECEHITIHRKIVLNGGKIFIHPLFINGGWNEHSLNKLWFIRVLRRFRRFVKNAANSIQ